MRLIGLSLSVGLILAGVPMSPAGAHPPLECQRYLEETTRRIDQKTEQLTDLAQMIVFLSVKEQEYIKVKSEAKEIYDMSGATSPDLEVKYDILEEKKQDIHQDTRAILDHALDILFSYKTVLKPLDPLFSCLRNSS